MELSGFKAYASKSSLSWHFMLCMHIFYNEQKYNYIPNKIMLTLCISTFSEGSKIFLKSKCIQEANHPSRTQLTSKLC